MLKNRLQLALHFAKLGFQSGAEIGACFGRYSQILCQNIPGLKLIAIDNWNNKNNSRREKTLGLSGEAVTREKLAPFNTTIIKKDSLDAAKDIPDGSLDFVFIDADHTYQAVKNDLIAWSKKVRCGGIVSGHDYYVFPNSGNRGVIQAVNEFTKEYGYELETTAWDKKNPDRDDRVPCWYFFKK